MRVLKPNEVNTQKMRSGLVINKLPETTYKLGGFSKIDRVVLCENYDWRPYLPVFELQRRMVNGIEIDYWDCVTFGGNNQIEILNKKLYGYEINLNERISAVGNGTKPRIGNDPIEASEWERKNGFSIGEQKWDNDKPLTEEEFYNNGVLPEEWRIDAKNTLNYYETNYEVGACGNKLSGYFSYPQNTLDNLKYSPMACAVYGKYDLDSDGYVASPYYNLTTHWVAVVAPGENKKFWYVLDSESLSLVKFNWNYPFKLPILKYLKKKTMIYKKKGQAGICLKTYGENTLLAFPDTLTWKTYTNGLKFDEIGGQWVDEWPYPIVGHFAVIKELGAELPIIED